MNSILLYLETLGELKMKNLYGDRNLTHIDACIQSLITIAMLCRTMQSKSFKKDAASEKKTPKQHMSNILEINEGNLSKYLRGSQRLGKKKLLFLLEKYPKTEQIFTFGPENTFLWVALSPSKSFSNLKKIFIESLNMYPTIIQEKIDIYDISYKEGTDHRQENIVYSSSWPWVLARCLEDTIETREKTAWQEIFEEIINFRGSQFNLPSSEKPLTLQDILERNDINRLAPWLELEKTLFKHIEMINRYGLTLSDFAWVLMAKEVKVETKNLEPIKEIQKNEFSIRYQLIIEEVYQLSSNLKK